MVLLMAMVLPLWTGVCESAAWAREAAAGLDEQNHRAMEWPQLPTTDAAVEIPAQEWPQRPGPRSVRILIHYPDGTLNSVNERTGLMLSLHNWGGTDCVGTADPRELARQLNVVAICVNYLQSGRADSLEAPEPYDCGWLQALDALRGLWCVFDGLRQQNRPFASDRIFSTGGSGGGNVTLMCNKLAPRTFTCLVDMCGMKKLSHDIAFDLPGGSPLNARWNRNPGHPGFLTVDEQEIRFVGHPDHLRTMKKLGTSARIVVVHGADDATCPFADAVEMVQQMQAAGLDVVSRYITANDLDGQIFTSSGHSLGNRTRIVLDEYGHLLREAGEAALRRPGATDFERREEIRYETTGGTFLVSWASGYPVGQFEPSPSPVAYSDHTDLMYWLDDSGQRHTVRDIPGWEKRRQDILSNFQRVTGPLPAVVNRVPLDVRIIEERQLMPPQVQRPLLRRKVSYQSDPYDRVHAWLFLPLSPADSQAAARPAALPAVLCLQQTTSVGKDEPAGIAGDPTLSYALQLAEAGFVTLAPDYPSFGEHAYSFAADQGYVSGTMKAVWDNMRAVDLLQTLPEVDPDRLGCIGHSLGGHNAIFTAVFEPRLKVVVSSCGFTSLQKDDIPSWSGPRYLPRLASQFSNDVNQVPFDFHELIGAIAPRPFLTSSATGDTDFDVTGVHDVMDAARRVYKLHGAEDRLHAVYPEAPHSFPDEARRRAIEFLQEHLAK